MSLALYSWRPRPLRIAGCDLVGRPLRVVDLVALADLAAGEPPPCPEGDPGDPIHRQALRDAAAAALAWPPDWPDALGTPPGALALLAAVLRDHEPDADQLAALALAMTADDWRAVRRVGFAGDPAVTIYGAIDRAIGVDDEGESIPWAEALAEVCRLLGRTPAEVGAMTLPEFRLIRGGGQRTIVNPESAPRTQLLRERFHQEEVSRRGAETAEERDREEKTIRRCRRRNTD